VNIFLRLLTNQNSLKVTVQFNSHLIYNKIRFENHTNQEAKSPNDVERAKLYVGDAKLYTGSAKFYIRCL